jgi:hypothetical protein
MRLSDLADSLELPDIKASDRAWDMARARVRRRRRIAVLGTTGAALLVVAVVQLGQGDNDGARPPVTSPSPSPSPSATPLPYVIPHDLITPRLAWGEYAELAAGAPRLEVTNPAPVSEDPVHRAVLAVVPSSQDLSGDERYSTVNVLGDDGRWRAVDVPGLVPTHDTVGYEGYSLSPTSLSDDGTHLALPQPHALVIVDLTQGTSRRYDVPGLNNAAVWRDDAHVLVSVEGRPMMHQVDLESGDVTEADFSASTRFLPDGSWVSWPGDRDLVTSDGSLSTTPKVGNSAGAQATVPLVGEDVIVGLTGYGWRVGNDTKYLAIGAVVIDRHTGEVLGVRASMTSNADFSQLLGVDERSVLMSVVQPRSTDRLLLRWDWANHSIDVIAVVPAGMMSWAGPVSNAAAIIR